MSEEASLTQFAHTVEDKIIRPFKKLNWSSLAIGTTITLGEKKGGEGSEYFGVQNEIMQSSKIKLGCQKSCGKNVLLW